MNIQSSTQPNAIPESRVDSYVAAAPAISPLRLFYWSLRREFWENRSLYLAPLAAAGFVLVGASLRFLHFRGAVSFSSHRQQHVHTFAPFDFAAGAVMAVVMIVGIFYSLDALYGERRDRSILFWKSLPVSDLITVLAKASIPIFILQFLAFAVIVATQFDMMLLGKLLGLAGVPTAWSHPALFAMWSILLYHLLTVHMLWHAPIYCWLLLVSAWARRAPFLWATIPLLVTAAGEKVAFNTAHFLNLLGYRLQGPENFAFTDQGIDPTMHSNLAHFLSEPGLWRGLLVAAIFIAITVRLRRYRDPV